MFSIAICKRFQKNALSHSVRAMRANKAIEWTILKGEFGRLLLILTMTLLMPAQQTKAVDSSEDMPLLGGSLLGTRPDRVSFAVGAFNVIRNDDEDNLKNNDISLVGQAEYRIGRKWYGLAPMAGIMANTDGGVFGYGAVYSDLAFGAWIITPSFGLGGYHRNGSKDLGGIFQFYASLGAAYEFADQSRLGLQMSHVSNAWIYDLNPGVEVVFVTYSVPIMY